MGKRPSTSRTIKENAKTIKGLSGEKKMINYKLRLFILILLAFGHTLVYAYDDRITHPEITKKAIKSSNLENYLLQNFGGQFPKGVESLVNRKTVLDWVMKGSTDEDSPI